MPEISIISLAVNGLWNVLSPYGLLLCTFGISLGIVVGALPGLSSTMACALLVPMTFSMQPSTGLILLGAIWCGAIYGGSNAAILLNIPGTPSSIATAFDGYPMTRKGQSERALFIGLVSSVVGGIVGVLVLLSAFAPLAALSVKFGKPEFFWLCIFGLSTIAALSPGNAIKGLLGASIGLLLGTIGLDPIIGIPRFTFGTEMLIEGIQLVPGLIGIFAFAQVLELTEQKSVVIAEYKTTPNLIRNVFGELFSTCKANLLRSSIIGTFIGMLPGAGGPVASLVAYGEAKRWDKDPKRFGSGVSDGIVASESANNAVIGASLVPMMGLGIPGCPTAAVVMSGLLVHGILPGSKMLLESGDIAYTFIMSLLLVNILMLFIGYGMLRLSANLLRVPTRLLIPMVLIMAVIGSYTLRSSMVDVYVMLGCGILSFFLGRAGVGAGPLSLGLVLGPLTEDAFNISLTFMQAKNSFLEVFITRPLCIFFILLTITSLCLPVLLDRRKRKKLLLNRKRKVL